MYHHQQNQSIYFLIWQIVKKQEATWRRCKVHQNGCSLTCKASEMDDAVSVVRHHGVDGFLGCWRPNGAWLDGGGGDVLSLI